MRLKLHTSILLIASLVLLGGVINANAADMATNRFIKDRHFGYAHAQSAIKDTELPLETRLEIIETLKTRELSRNSDKKAYQQGVEEAIAGKPAPYTHDVVRKAIEELEIQETHHKRQEGIMNRQKGVEFLASNILQDSKVITTSSGLQYKIIKAGDNVRAKPNSQVVLHYVAKSIDGLVLWGEYLNEHELANTYQDNEPVTMSLNDSYDFWYEGLKNIGQGGMIELYVPNELNGYDDALIFPNLPAGMTVIYTVELLQVKSS